MSYPIAYTIFFVLCISAVMIHAILGVLSHKELPHKNYIHILLVLFVVGTSAIVPDITVVYSVLTGGSTESPNISVATDGSGDYNSDGASDQVQINEALQHAKSNNIEIVYLKSGTYTIDDSIQIPDGMTLTGDADAIVRLVENWDVTRSDMFTPMITGTEVVSENFKKGSNITISGFTLDGNKDNQDAISAMDEIDSFPAIQFYYSGHITVKDMVIRNIPGDGIRLSNGESYHQILKNRIHDTGHDDIFIMHGNYDVIDANILSHVAHDSGIRLDDSANVQVTNNTIWTNNDGLSGIYLLKHDTGQDSHNITIAYNTIYNTREMGILLAMYANDMPVTSARDVYIHDNIINGAGVDSREGHPYGGGIWLDGWNNTLIQGNVIDSNMGDGIAYSQRLPGHNYTAAYTTFVRDNIIINTIDSPLQSDDGYGINNRLGENYSFVLENNIVWNNENGNYNNVGPQDSDINVNPLFADPFSYISYKKDLWWRYLRGTSSQSDN